jgi:hypothetical protein
MWLKKSAKPTAQDLSGKHYLGNKYHVLFEMYYELINDLMHYALLIINCEKSRMCHLHSYSIFPPSNKRGGQ